MAWSLKNAAGQQAVVQSDEICLDYFDSFDPTIDGSADFRSNNEDI